MTTTIAIEAVVLGQKMPRSAGCVLALPPEWEDATERVRLRDLVARIVREQVAAFKERQACGELLRVLTPGEIAQGAHGGRFVSGGRDLDQDVDPRAAVEVALQAHEDGLYFVFVDDRQHRSLDDVVRLRPDSRVTFVRLVALAGG